jgi:hypothetical protein
LSEADCGFLFASACKDSFCSSGSKAFGHRATEFASAADNDCHFVF